MSTLAIDIPQEKLAEFCQRWKIVELSLFGSVLREDFQPDSDVDFLAVFQDDVPWSLLDIIQAEDELSTLVGRPVDLVERSVVEQSENWIRRRRILNSARTIYAG
jgi:hypothetical protein